MKVKLFLTAFLAVAALTVSCEKGDGGKDNGDGEITLGDVTMPSSDTPISPGAPVTVHGSGFEQGDKIVIRSQVRSTVDLEAAVTSITASGITFVIPAGVPSGETEVVLKRGEKELSLGKITIAQSQGPGDGGDPQPTTLYGIIDERSICLIDKSTGQYTILYTLPEEDMSLYDFVAVPGSDIVYGIKEDWSVVEPGEKRYLVAFDTRNNTLTDICPLDDGNRCLVAVGEKLCALCNLPDGQVVLETFDPAAGTFDQGERIATLPSVPGATYVELDRVYKYEDRIVYVRLWAVDMGGSDEWYFIATLNLSAKTISVSDENTNIRCIYRRDGVTYALSPRVINYNTPEESSIDEIFKVDPATLRLGDMVAQFERGTDWYLFDPATNSLYGAGWGRSVWSFDLKTNNFTKYSSPADFSSIFLK